MRGLAHRRAVVPLAVAVVGDEAVVARDLGDAVAMLVARGVRLVDVSLSFGSSGKASDFDPVTCDDSLCPRLGVAILSSLR